jgi:TM2 domain-containing membrane protein YozV
MEALGYLALAWIAWLLIVSLIKYVAEPRLWLTESERLFSPKGTLKSA